MHSRSPGSEALQAGDEVAVVEDVAVGERGALREPGRARRVLDVDRVVGPQPCPPRGELVVGRPPPAPATSSSQSSSQKKIARSRPGTSGRDLLDHVDVVGRLERRRGEQHPAARLVEGVRQLVGAVRRVDVDEDDADLGRGVLQQRPLGVVRAPQPDPVAGLEAERRSGPWRSASTRSAKLVVRPADALVAGDERLDVAVGGDRAGQVGADRLVEQRDVGRSGIGGERRHRDPPGSSSTRSCSRRTGPSARRSRVGTSRGAGVDAERAPRRDRRVGVGDVVDDAVLGGPRLGVTVWRM